MTEKRLNLDNVKNGLGALAVVACFLLASPGVEIARAESPSAPPVAPVAEAPAPVEYEAAKIDGEIEQVPRSEDARRDAVNGVVVLNTRGYNYGPDRPTARPVQATAPAAPAAPE